MENISIKVIPPEDDRYDQVQTNMRASVSSVIDYNDIARKYNASHPNTILLITIPKSARLDNMRRIFSNRGVECGEDLDYTLTRIIASDTGAPPPEGYRMYALTKLSEVAIRII